MVCGSAMGSGKVKKQPGFSESGERQPCCYQVILNIHDELSWKVAILLDQALYSGQHEVQWHADDQPSGMYFCMMDADGFVVSRRVVVVR